MKLLATVLILSMPLLVACKRSRGPETGPASASGLANQNSAPRPNQPCIDLNRASPAELMRLPGIGEVMSQRIVEYREQHGPFRRPSDVIIIEGFSEKKFRAIAEYLCDSPFDEQPH